ncbi:hypothetical protein FSP39_025100 [Pinctada imbricata]|uniref:Uncharacterized protein n=1 Tax=Pinctada imbricata TaxID=66713 RepID=A0AA89BWH9_PINIB|nr:hypothetical protein FSP39_025100 [Pinctada imbricata]
MPLRNICITYAVLQLFSVVTFFSFYGNRENYYHISSQIRGNSPDEAFKWLKREDGLQNQKFRDPLAKLCLHDDLRDQMCPILFMGNNDIANGIDRKHTNLSYQCRISELIKDCSKLIRAHEYHAKPVSQAERDFPLAFAIKMHRDPEQAEQLLRAIYRPHNVYCIYVDGKSSTIIHDIMRKIARCFSNIFVIEERLKVIYGSYAHMQSDLQCMRVLMKSGQKWKYYINLTGQEFPLKTNLEIVEILKSMNGANDIESYTIPIFLKWRHEKHFYTSSINIVETSDKKQPFRFNMEISKGSAYGAYSRKFVDFILTDGFANEFINWLNDTYSPEESVWATLNTLPWAPGGYEYEIRHRYGNFLSRATIWEDDKSRCHGLYVRGVCTFGIGDLPWLINRPNLFANKFNVHMDRVVMDCLEDLNRNRTNNPDIYSLNWFYYRNLPHAKLYAERDVSKYYSDKNMMLLKEEWMKKQTRGDGTKSSRRSKSDDRFSLPGSSMNMYTVRA